MNLQMFKLDLEKNRGTRDQIANICWIIKKARELQNNICFCFIDYAKAFDCVDHNKVWKILKEMGIPDHLSPEKLVCMSKRDRTKHGTTDWFQIGKEHVKAVYCHPAYLASSKGTSCEMLG